MNLFIIGNGFDLAHNLPTTYEHFHKYLKRTYPEAVKMVPSFNIASTMMPDGEEVYDDTEVVAFLIEVISRAEEDGDKWSDVETSLGNLDFEQYFDEMSYLYDEEDEDFNYFHQAYDYEDVSNNFFEVTLKIKQLFSNWINSIKITSVAPKDTFKSLINNSEDYFINFNYTSLLEELYEAENVFHLHGQQNSRIIIGHGVNKESFENTYIGTEFALAKIHSSLRKDTSKIIENWKEMFNYLRLTQNIFSHGFSFSEVDLPYIKKICEVVDTQYVTWHLNDYDTETTRSIYMDRIRNCGFMGDFSIFRT